MGHLLAPTILQTGKTLVSSELLTKYVRMLSCEFADGHAEDSYSIHTIDRNLDVYRCHGGSSEALQAMALLAGKIGRKGVAIWSRCGLGSSTFRTTSKHGPHWGQVQGRVTMELKVGRVIEAKMVDQINRSMEHAKVPSGNKNDTFLSNAYISIKYCFASQTQNSIRSRFKCIGLVHYMCACINWKCHYCRIA